eukprot:5753966-Pyramimonas_sp.AAC.1
MTNQGQQLRVEVCRTVHEGRTNVRNAVSPTGEQGNQEGLMSAKNGLDVTGIRVDVTGIGVDVTGIVLDVIGIGVDVIGIGVDVIGGRTLDGEADGVLGGGLRDHHHVHRRLLH